MTQRENLISNLLRKGYDSVPVDFNLCPHLVDIYNEREKTSLPYSEYFHFPWQGVDYPTPINSDISRFNKYHKDSDLSDPAFNLDSLGVGHRKTPTSMHMTQMINPLENADSEAQVAEYPLEDFDEVLGVDEVKGQVESVKKSGLAAVGNMQCTIWESAWYIRGMENLMMDMMSDDPIATILLDRVTAMSKKRAEILTKAGVDILFLGDDIGMQKTIMMSQTLYDEWLKPRLADIIKSVKQINPNLLVFYHSCGFVEPFIDTLIEVGVDVLNPVQPECMDFKEIHAKYGDRISFNGTIGTQTTMPFGTPQEVRREVERNLTIAGDKGGLFVAPTHLLEPEVPWENILAYVDACKRFKG